MVLGVRRAGRVVYPAMHMFDYVLAGGGLQSGLIALAVRARQPDATIALIERDAALGGNHTWCFHHQDVPEGARDWLAPLVEWRWPGYSVHFHDFETKLDEPYAGVSSSRLNEAVTRALSSSEGCVLRLGTTISDVAPDRVVLSGGEEVVGRAVIDARGARHSDASRMDAGYQKFVGQEVELSAPHGLDRPILMDATVDQTDGYRFFYVLPFGDRRVLIEDTRFHDSPTLDVDLLREEIRTYAASRGWSIDVVIREEQGVLPMPWRHRIEPAGRAPLLAGYRGGWFHPGTGYSFPVALRLADFVASRPPSALFGRALADLSREHRRQSRFPRFLNRLLFRWYPPPHRHPIFARVYRLPRPILRNFYALRLSWSDRVRLLVGRPPPGLSIRHRIGSRSEP